MIQAINSTQGLVQKQVKPLQKQNLQQQSALANFNKQNVNFKGEGEVFAVTGTGISVAASALVAYLFENYAHLAPIIAAAGTLSSFIIGGIIKYANRPHKIV